MPGEIVMVDRPDDVQIIRKETAMKIWKITAFSEDLWWQAVVAAPTAEEAISEVYHGQPFTSVSADELCDQVYETGRSTVLGWTQHRKNPVR